MSAKKSKTKSKKSVPVRAPGLYWVSFGSLPTIAEWDGSTWEFIGSERCEDEDPPTIGPLVVPPSDFAEKCRRPGYYRLQNKQIALWTGEFWLRFGDPARYTDGESEIGDTGRIDFVCPVGIGE